MGPGAKQKIFREGTMKAEKAGALILLAFCLAYGIAATQIPLTFIAMKESFNARTMPYALSIIGILLSTAILILPASAGEGKERFTEVFKGLDWTRVGLLVAIMIFYGLTLRFLGFVISSTLFLLGGFYILGERRRWLLILGSVPLVLFIWFLMSKILGMYIAPGEIFYLMGII
jgi:putative tricarboxylic transport membrane protein